LSGVTRFAKSVKLLEQNLNAITDTNLENQLLSFLILLSIDDAKQIHMEFYKAKSVAETVLNKAAW
jgi:hypothetical protein